MNKLKTDIHDQTRVFSIKIVDLVRAVIKPVLVAFLSVVSPLVLSEQLAISGNLEQFLKSVDYGGAKDEKWVEPTAEQEVSFRLMVNAFLSSDYAAAASFGNAIGYDVIEYADTEVSPVAVHYLLMEQVTVNQVEFRGWGVYARYFGGRDVLIQAPHPQTDLYTERQAIELYLDSSSGLLALAGTRRDSTASMSDCTGTYYKSDGAHNTSHPFQYFHETVSDFSSETSFLQLHGFGSSSLKKLKKQCRSRNDNLVNLSEGIKYRPGKNQQSLMLTLEAQIDGNGLIDVCIYGRDTKTLGATSNVGGRDTNGSVDACTVEAEDSAQRWIHIEQSYQVRSGFRAEINQAIIQALDAWPSTTVQ